MFIEPTQNTPEVRFDSENNVFTLIGVSMPENSIKFYEQVFSWLDEYQKNPHDNLRFHVQLEYFNTSSSKSILDIFKRVKNIGNGNYIVWHYEEDDDEIREAGEEYQEIIGADIIRLASIDA